MPDTRCHRTSLRWLLAGLLYAIGIRLDLLAERALDLAQVIMAPLAPDCPDLWPGIRARIEADEWLMTRARRRTDD